jgi:hypothetical protein
MKAAPYISSFDIISGKNRSFHRDPFVEPGRLMLILDDAATVTSNPRAAHWGRPRADKPNLEARLYIEGKKKEKKKGKKKTAEKKPEKKSEQS